MNSILQNIIAYKKEYIRKQKVQVPCDSLKKFLGKNLSDPRFAKALQQSGIGLIAEVKKASPSKGVIRRDFDCVDIAQSYAKAGAACLSVLTEDKYFKGDLSFLKRIKAVVDVPLLRKDFIIDEYQLYESKAAGADAILLIASILEGPRLKDFCALASVLKLDVLLEIHTLKELQKVLDTGVQTIGINARNLDDFSVDLDILKPLMDAIPLGHLIVCESGIKDMQDLAFVKNFKPDAILVGEALMREKDIFSKTRAFARFLTA